MRIAIGWSNISGYMASCWRALGNLPSVEAKVWAFAPKQSGGQAPFDPATTMHGIDHVLLTEEQKNDGQWMADQWAQFQPDVILIPGWLCPAYNTAIQSNHLAHATKIMGIDLPWQGTPKQHIACRIKRKHVQQFDHVWVAGERAYQYAKRLLRSDEKIQRGVYSYDSDIFSPIALSRPQDSEQWPRKFLFVGRYAAVKGLDTLLEAYGNYRQKNAVPWELHCCGTGPLKHLLANQPGVIDHGFTQPANLPQMFEQASCFVIASHFEPWGLVIAEAMGSGLPVLASTECGAAIELLQPLHNGRFAATASTKSFENGLQWFHDNTSLLPKMSTNAHRSASGYTCHIWAKRFLEMTKNSCARQGTQ